jgi:hypothetical protein
MYLALRADVPNFPADCSEKVATDCLKTSGWGVEQAIDHFYTSGLAAQTSTGGVDLRAIDALYQRYKGKGPIGLTQRQ